MSNNKVNLKELFKGLQSQMVAQLSTNRAFIEHPGSKGDALENTWIEWLRAYLPNRYKVDKAIVIDCVGQLSHQIDLVIYDRQYTPFVLKQNGMSYIPAEGVYAVFEVKPDLKPHISYAGEKIESVRKLKRTSTHIIDRGRKYPPRALTKIVGGILATTNKYKKQDTIKNHFENLKGLQTVDMGCVVNYGSFYIDYDGEENKNEQNLENRIHDYYKSRKLRTIEFSTPEISLVTFFFQLMRYLQQSIGTIAAIDLNEYSKTIDFPIDKEI